MQTCRQTDGQASVAKPWMRQGGRSRGDGEAVAERRTVIAASFPHRPCIKDVRRGDNTVALRRGGCSGGQQCDRRHCGETPTRVGDGGCGRGLRIGLCGSVGGAGSAGGYNSNGVSERLHLGPDWPVNIAQTGFHKGCIWDRFGR